MTKECPNCGKEILSDADFCGFCGHKFEKINCPNCGILIKSGLSFCPECGVKLNDGKKPSLDNLDPGIKKQLMDEVKKELDVDIKREALKEVKWNNRKQKIRDILAFCYNVLQKIKNADDDFLTGVFLVMLSALFFLFCIIASYLNGGLDGISLLFSIGIALLFIIPGISFFLE